jgi:aromatic-L-amino-acid decarboxylase
MKHDEGEIRRWAARVGEFVARYLSTLDERPLQPRRGREAIESLFAGSIPEAGAGVDATLAQVEHNVVPNSFHLAGSGYFGLFNPTPTVAAVLADAMAGALNQQLAAYNHSPAATTIERTVIRWLAEMCGMPATAGGSMTNGGSLANATAIKVALNEHVRGVAEDGVDGHRPVFYVSDQAHYSFEKTADLLGLGRSAARAVPTDARFRVDLRSLEEAIERDARDGREPFAIVGNAGTTSSGAIDALLELAKLADRLGLWFHVDAAWGGAARLSRKHAALLDGIERADSITIDPHKWLYVPYSAGAVVVRDADALRRTFDVSHAYVSDRSFDAPVNYYQHGIAGSRRFDALKVWATIVAYGRKGYEEAVDSRIALAEELARRLEGAGNHLCAPPSLAVVCWRDPRLDDEGHHRVQHAIEQEGRVWISTTVLGGRRAFRFCATSYLTTEKDLDALMDALQRRSR